MKKLPEKNYEWDILAETKKVWVCWEARFIANSYEEAIDYSINNGMIIPFGDWLTQYTGYSIEDVFELTENVKVIVKAQYSEYIRTRIADEWTEREIVLYAEGG